tara:strand:- start:529 stop:861 length:333 start_codon:yes stop_codon:yes gene_type:complete
MFKMSKGRLHLTFPESNWKLSIGCTSMHYVTQDKQWKDENDEITSNNVELAVLDEKGEWRTKEIAYKVLGEVVEDDVLGYVTFNDWIKIISYLNTMPRDQRGILKNISAN